jgi:hypothetical protein
MLLGPTSTTHTRGAGFVYSRTKAHHLCNLDLPQRTVTVGSAGEDLMGSCWDLLGEAPDGENPLASIEDLVALPLLPCAPG